MTRRLRAVCLALAVTFGGVAGSDAQDGAPEAPVEAVAGSIAHDAAVSVPADWEAAVEQGEARLADPEATTEELEALREKVLPMRSAALPLETTAAAAVAEVNARLQALGPPPAEGATEAAEIAERRTRINAELAAAQAPLLEIQDFHRRADRLIGDIDRVVRARFAAELRRRGPSPLRPSNWTDTVRAVSENVAERRAQVRATLENAEARAALARRVPLDILLAVVGIGLAFSVNRRVQNAVEAQLSHASGRTAIALLVAARNVSRLLVPAAGAGLLFAALDPEILVDPSARSRVFHLPGFIVAVIWASWLGSSVFAPRLAAYRLAPLPDDEAVGGARLSLAFGVLVAAKLLMTRYVADWDLTTAESATLAFPLFVIGGLLMWRLSRLVRAIRRRIDERDKGAAAGDRVGAISLGVLEALRRGAWVIAVFTPLLAALGYLAAASHLLFGGVLTLAVFATGVVLYDLATTTLGALGGRHGDASRDVGREGLFPVVVATVLTLASLPILALVWGARASDIADVWFMLRDGVSVAGMRISVGTLTTFVLVFGALYGLSRLLQSVLRSTVLPRTKMDAGGKNAVLAGVGYVGFFIAVMAAVSSTGIDLTSLAVVAGALSVGIGFGLQNIVSNFVSGIILLVERPIKEGDWIEVGGQMGYVRGISVRSTEIETFDRASVILPNSDLVAGTVLNRTHTGMTGRLTVPVGVSYASEPRHVERVMLEIAEAHPMVLLDPAPVVLFMGFGADSLNFEIRCWLRDVNFSLSARSDLNFEIFERFRKEGISIPFPQRVVEIKNAGAFAKIAEASGAPPASADDPPKGDLAADGAQDGGPTEKP